MSVANRREREREERRAQIVLAAANVFKSKGFSASTMDDIATEAELSKGTLYLYFKSKDELFLAISNVKLRQVDERFTQILTRECSGLEKLEAMLHGYAGVALTDPEMFRTAVMWIGSGQLVDIETPAFCNHRACVTGVITKLVAAIEQGKTDGSIRADAQQRALAGQIWGGMLGTLLIRINAGELSRRMPQLGDLDEQVPGFIRLVCDGLRGHGRTT
jgi:YD repeat-containing protein